jgi:hypothetical protein
MSHTINEEEAFRQDVLKSGGKASKNSAADKDSYKP